MALIRGNVPWQHPGNAASREHAEAPSPTSHPSRPVGGEHPRDHGFCGRFQGVLSISRTPPVGRRTAPADLTYGSRSRRPLHTVIGSAGRLSLGPIARSAATCGRRELLYTPVAKAQVREGSRNAIYSITRDDPSMPCRPARRAGRQEDRFRAGLRGRLGVCGACRVLQAAAPGAARWPGAGDQDAGGVGTGD